jgi:hypothetical protein
MNFGCPACHGFGCSYCRNAGWMNLERDLQEKWNNEDTAKRHQQKTRKSPGVVLWLRQSVGLECEGGQCREARKGVR